jgi:hypothetical protein
MTGFRYVRQVAFPRLRRDEARGANTTPSRFNSPGDPPLISPEDQQRSPDGAQAE